jgi:hypothetical protein
MVSEEHRESWIYPPIGESGRLEGRQRSEIRRWREEETSSFPHCSDEMLYILPSLCGVEDIVY